MDGGAVCRVLQLRKVHKTLRVTPAMEAGLMDRVLTFEDVVTIMERVAPKPGKRGHFKKTASA